MILVTAMMVSCVSSPPVPEITARERFQARLPEEAIGSRGASLQVPPEIASAGGPGGAAGRLGLGRGGFGRFIPRGPSDFSSPPQRPRSDKGPLEALEGGRWALRDRAGVLRVVDPALGIIAMTTEEGHPTPDGRWLMPSAQRLDPAPMEGIRRARRGDWDWVWGEQHAVALRRADARTTERRKDPQAREGASPDGRWIPRAIGPSPAGWVNAAKPAGLLLEGTDGRAGPRLAGCLSESQVRWSPDSRRLTCRTERGLSAFDTRGRALGEWVVAEQGFDPEDAAWSPRLDQVVLVGAGKVIAWDLATGPLWETRVAGADHRLSAIVTDDDSLVVVTDGDATAVLDAADGRRLDDVDHNPSGTANRVALLSDGGWVAVSRGMISWWDAQGQRLGRTQTREDPLVVDGKPCWLQPCPQRWQLKKTELVSDDGQRIALDIGDWARLEHRSPSGRWWLVTGRGETRAVDLDRQELHPVKRGRDALAIDDQGTIWRATSEGVEGRALDGGIEVIPVDRPVHALEVHPDLLVVGLAGGELRKIQRPARSLPHPLPSPVPPRPQTLVRSLPSGVVGWLPDGRLVVGGTQPVAVDPHALVAGAWTTQPAPPEEPAAPRVESSRGGWVLLDGAERIPIPGLPRGRGAVVSANGQKVAVLEDTGVWLWSRADGLQQRLPVDRPSAVALSPDGAKLAVAAAGQIELVYPATAQIRQVAPAPHRPQLAFSPDGRWLAVGPQLLLIDVESGELRFDAASETFLGVHALALAPDGQQLAILDDRGRLGLWHLDNGTRRWRSEPLGQPSSVRFLSDGTIEARLQTGTARFDPAGQLVEAHLGPTATALSVDDHGQVRVLDAHLGWVGWDRTSGLPVRLEPPRRDPAWSEVTGGIRATWAIPGFTGSVPPDEPPCVSVPTSMACSSVPANHSPVVTAGLSWLSPSPGGGHLIGRKSEGGAWVLRGPNGAEVPLSLPQDAQVAWAGPGQAIAVGNRKIWQIGADGSMERSPAPSSSISLVAAQAGRVALWAFEAVMVGPVGSDAVTCVLPSHATLAAFSPNGRFLAWSDHSELMAADVERCRIELSARPQRSRPEREETWLRYSPGYGDESASLDEYGPDGLQRRWDLSDAPSVSAVARGPGETAVLATRDGQIRIVDLTSLPALPLEARSPAPTSGERESAGGTLGGTLGQLPGTGRPRRP